MRGRGSTVLIRSPLASDHACTRTNNTRVIVYCMELDAKRQWRSEQSHSAHNYASYVASVTTCTSGLDTNCVFFAVGLAYQQTTADVI